MRLFVLYGIILATATASTMLAVHYHVDPISIFGPLQSPYAHTTSSHWLPTLGLLAVQMAGIMAALFVSERYWPETDRQEELVRIFD